MLDPPLLMAFERTFLEFLIILIQSFFVKLPAFLLGLILHKNKISLAYILPIPETKF